MTKAEAYHIAKPFLDKGIRTMYVADDGTTFRHLSLAERYKRLEGFKFQTVNQGDDAGPEVDDQKSTSDRPAKKPRKSKK